MGCCTGVVYGSTISGGGGGGGAVSSVFTRLGDVVAESGDYNTDQVTEGATNLYFTDQRARSSLSSTAPLNYDSVTGLFDITQAASGVSGYLLGSDWTAFNAKVDRSGDTMTGYLNLVGVPVSGGQAANKNYVDNLINGLNWKSLVEAATEAALPAYIYDNALGTITATANGALPNIDDYAPSATNRILIKSETGANDIVNGIYVITQLGDGGTPFILTRSTDADSNTELKHATVSVSNGTVNLNAGFTQNTDPVVIGTTPIEWVPSLNTTYTATGLGVTLTGNEFALQLDGTTLSQSGSGVKVADDGITNTQVNSAAGIARSKLANGTGNRMVVNGATGGMQDHTAQTANTVAVYDANGLPASTTATYAAGNFTFAGLIKLPASTSTVGKIQINNFDALKMPGTENTFVGYSGSQAPGGQRNTAMGSSSLTNLSTGGNNSSYGYGSLNAVTTASQNVAMGQVALSLVQTGGANTAVGALAGQNIAAAGANNSLVGFSAGRYQIGSDIVAVGRDALAGNSTPANNTGTANTAVGYFALSVTSSGSTNTAVGNVALSLNTSGSSNVAMGYFAGRANTTGTQNVMIGTTSGSSSTTTSNSTYVGYNSGRYQINERMVGIGSGALTGNSTPANNTGTQSTAIGYNALNANSSGVSNVAIGYNVATLNTSGSQHTIVGAISGGALTTGSSATLFGYATGSNISTGSSMVAVGDSAQRYITGGSQVSVGHQALRGNSTPANNTGSGNNAFGYQALTANSSGSNNNAFGYQSGVLNTSGSDNTFYGNVSGTSNTTGGSNNFFGSGAGQFQSTASRNHAFGYRSLRGNATPALNTGVDNYAFGYASLFTNTSGSQNIGLGYQTLYLNSTGSNNIAIGHNALENATGSNNTAIGIEAGNSIVAGASNIFIGKDSGNNASQLASANGSIAIGADSYTEASNQMAIGSTGYWISDFRLGTGSSSISPIAITLQPSKVTTGTVDVPGATFNINGGLSTGTGRGGVINFFTSGQGASGSVENPPNARFTIQTFGTLTGYAMHNNISDPMGNSLSQDIRSGTYTPTLGAGTNITSSIPRNCMWSRVGNIVTVSGTIELTYTVSATPSSMTMSLPVSSANFTTTYQGSGTALVRSVAGLGPIIADIAPAIGTQSMQMQMLSNSSAGSQEHRFTFQYEVV